MYTRNLTESMQKAKHCDSETVVDFGMLWTGKKTKSFPSTVNVGIFCEEKLQHLEFPLE